MQVMNVCLLKAQGSMCPCLEFVHMHVCNNVACRITYDKQLMAPVWQPLFLLLDCPVRLMSVPFC